MPKKEHVPIAKIVPLNVMALRPFISNGFAAADVINGLFGNDRTSKNAMSFPGFSFGSRKAIPSEGCQIFPDTAHSKLNKSKIIGWLKSQNQITISQRSDMSFMTVRTLEKTIALLLS